ncbi:hypothetical protein FHW83_005682 [Duganella sp. SG902]|uniref:DUF4351 domain-containing protein n=1 Tax=Duganella sp. SG902 TaxID=2587016 RepID=UPI00159EAB90|nr:DUF4351 domain-containing protein [Duganella sp. SG902]NVM79840.1 hypothetical protein [Duganella sp. SG902]
MPHPSPPSRYDSPWKAAIGHAFRDFMDFFFPALSAEIDWAQKPQFRDKELAGISHGDVPHSLVADKLVEVRLCDGNAGWVLIHIEVQAQRDVALARRIFDYNYRIHKEHQRPVASLVVLADEARNWRPCIYHYARLGTELSFSFAIVKLLDYADRPDELQASDNLFALLTLAHLRTQQARHDPGLLYAAKWQATRLLYEHGWRKERILVMFDVINWMMVLPEPYQQRYWQAIRGARRERVMFWIGEVEQSFIDKGWKKGRKEGLKEGLQEGRNQGLEQGIERGRKEGAAVLLERQLVRRFGPLPQSVRNRLARASMAQLEAWSERLLEAETLRQVFR